MVSIRAFRADPHFADLFEHVHVMCWPILWWQLNTLFRWCKREGIPDVLYSVNDWGFITVRHFGEKPDPAAYTPLPRTVRPLTDASWASALPACLASGFLAAPCVLLSCEAGGGGVTRSEQTQGALAWPCLDTS
jgi:hypothetical protein